MARPTKEFTEARNKLFSRFWELLPRCNTYQKAYEIAEMEREQSGQPRLYSSFKSFQRALSRHNKM